VAEEPAEPDESAAIRASVRGRVQGVGFRDYVYMRARFLHVTGYVRNLSDGRSVEIVAEGRRSSLQRLLGHLQEGPRMCRVDEIAVDWTQPSAAYTDFDVAF
jgi:acylphosphatase